MHRKAPLLLGLCMMLSLAWNGAARAADPNKVLRIASPDIETLDPQQIEDIPSRDVLRAIFEGLYEYDYLASPPRLAPLTAAALPGIVDGGRTWTIRLNSGIFFTDDPAFHGKSRELVADDYVYSLKRALDPNLRRGGDPITTDLIVGARRVVDDARAKGKFDYDQSIDGLRALDRYTIQLRLKEPNYPVIRDYLNNGVVAREVIEAAGGDIRTRAVGTGPYRLREWKRGSRVVLEANSRYRPLGFPESPDPANAALVRRMQGKTLPQIGVIEINLIEEDITRLLEFDRGRLDYVALRGEVANRLLANGKLKPEYVARGIAHHVYAEPFLFALYFNVADAVVGGMSNERVALRRAMALALDRKNLVDVVFAGQAMPANQLVPPGVSGHDPMLATKPQYDPAAAKSLLDRSGYGNLDAEGYRKDPDGKPLTVILSVASGDRAREIQTWWKKSMNAIGLRTQFRVTPFQDFIKETDAGNFQVKVDGYGGTPSGYGELIQLYSHEPPTINGSRFSSAEYDRAMEQFLRSATDADEIAAARKMSELALTYVPLLPTVFRLENDFVQPWLLGFRPQLFSTYWKYLDIDLAQRERAGPR
jgi:peptide/nickel transport system substrate-binding protein